MCLISIIIINNLFPKYIHVPIPLPRKRLFNNSLQSNCQSNPWEITVLLYKTYLQQEFIEYHSGLQYLWVVVIIIC